MPWVKIPNEVVQYMGRPIRYQALDDNGEGRWKPFQCPVTGKGASERCSEKFTNIQTYTEHLRDAHDMSIKDADVNITQVMEDATIGRMIMSALFSLRSAAYESIRKPLDGDRCDEVMRRIRNCITLKRDYWQLRTDDHKWLVDLLDRKLPVTVDGRQIKASEAGEYGVERQTFGMKLFGVEEAAVRWQLTPLGERTTAPERDDPDADALAALQEQQTNQPRANHREEDAAIPAG